MLPLLHALLLGSGLGLSQAPIGIAPGIYSFEEVARMLSIDGRQITCEKAIKGRACVLSLRSRTWEETQKLLFDGLGVGFEKTNNPSGLDFRMIEPPDVRLRRRKMRQQLLSAYISSIQNEAATILDTVAASNWSTEDLAMRLANVQDQVQSAASDGERNRLQKLAIDLAAAKDFQSGKTRYGLDLYLSCCPNAPEDIFGAPNGWIETAPSALPRGGDPLKPQKCFAGWQIRRTPMALSICPTWIMLSARSSETVSAFAVPEINLRTPQSTLNSLRFGEELIRWKGFGALVDQEISVNGGLDDQGLSSPLTSITADSVPSALVDWSTAMGREVIEEVQPSADALNATKVSTLKDALAAVPQLMAWEESGCLVVKDMLQFLDESIPYNLGALLASRSMVGKGEDLRALTEPMMEAFKEASCDPQSVPWTWQGDLPTSYLGLPLHDMAAGLLAFTCWKESGRPTMGRIPLSSLGAATLGSISEACRGSIASYLGYLPNIVELLSAEDLVIEPRGANIEVRLESRAGNAPAISSTLRFQPRH